ncbi:MAG TPA: 1-acyl-sn-glycerol-3-phosphate acyltransferase [Burkholderiales bacterium]|jgi:glycerol-3-phosphate O-acyltransferase|nr:1-acyl-sn-glycerol-3-phosphate acyltransferase [Burkholderiales bacterium]
MTHTVALPAWLLLCVAALALWAIWDHVLGPAWRGFMSRTANQVIDELSTRLRIGIRPWQRTRRQALIDRLITDPKVEAAAEQFARQNKLSQPAALRIVERYARETVPAFNAYFYFRVGCWMARKVAQSLYRVRLGYVDSDGLARVDSNATVVFVMNHRSNMDYVLAAYLAAEQTSLSYAVGEWAQIWPLSALIRSMGAYFVRRQSRNELYRRVLERYVAMATEAGVPQAVFPEGGLTRDGLMREPKLGVLDYMMRGFRNDGERDLVFVPLGINYDRVLEDRTLLLSIDPHATRPGRVRALWNTLAFAGRNLRLMLKSEWHRFGYACVTFGTPISMREYCTAHGLDFQRLGGDDRRRAMARLGSHLMNAVGRIVPVVPVPLIATVFTSEGAPLSELQLKARVERLLERLEVAGAHTYLPRRDLDYALTVGLRMLLLRRLVEERDGLYAACAQELPVLRYYANSIAHLLPAGAPIASPSA